VLPFVTTSGSIPRRFHLSNPLGHHFGGPSGLAYSSEEALRSRQRAIVYPWPKCLSSPFSVNFEQLLLLLRKLANALGRKIQ
jgi:hypothetical protein